MTPHEIAMQQMAFASFMAELAMLLFDVLIFAALLYEIGLVRREVEHVTRTKE